MTEEYQGGVKVAKCRSLPCLGERRPLIKSHVYVIVIFLSYFLVLIFTSCSLHRLKFDLPFLSWRGLVYIVLVVRVGWNLAEVVARRLIAWCLAPDGL